MHHVEPVQRDWTATEQCYQRLKLLTKELGQAVQTREPEVLFTFPRK